MAIMSIPNAQSSKIPGVSPRLLKLHHKGRLELEVGKLMIMILALAAIWPACLHMYRVEGWRIFIILPLVGTCVGLQYEVQRLFLIVQLKRRLAYFYQEDEQLPKAIARKAARKRAVHLAINYQDICGLGWLYGNGGLHSGHKIELATPGADFAPNRASAPPQDETIDLDIPARPWWTNSAEVINFWVYIGAAAVAVWIIIALLRFFIAIF